MTPAAQPLPADASPVRVVELRRYLLHPGTRGSFAELFEREFVAEHGACGMALGGRYGDAARDDVFVWMRGFPSMAARKASLEAFYLEGECWRRWRDDANGMMIDSDDVLLLEPLDPAQPLTPQAPVTGRGHIGVAPVASLDELDDVRSSVEAIVGGECRWWVTSDQENDFPGLPVREVTAVVWYGESAADPAVLEQELRSALGDGLELTVLTPAADG